MQPNTTYEANIKEKLQSLSPIGSYQDKFRKEVSEHKRRISTGFTNLDIALQGGLVDELYIMGAETSTGKSAFMMALAQNVAQQGVNVLYFALEMGKSEFVARGISMISFEQNPKNAFSAGDILYHKYDEQLQTFTSVPYKVYEQYADEYYHRYGEHLYIIESGQDGLTAKDVANIAALYQRQHPEVPTVVFLDYLQLLRADTSDRSQSDRKTKTDVAVTTLKTLASQIGMPVFTISSINRSSYSGKVGSSAFKESGDTEYTGGILLGWNWLGVTDAKNDADVAKEKQACVKRGYRCMMLEVIKFRNSARDQEAYFDYYPAYNYFSESIPDDGIPYSFIDDVTPTDKEVIHV